ncbi:MAG: LTA synthase family protein [Bacillota bacterium]
MNRKTKNLLFMLGTLLLLLGVRLGFFLKDGTSDTIETILIWTIFLGSMAVFIYAFLYPKAYILYRWRPQFPTVLTGLSIVTLDLLFIYKNGMAVDRPYFFSTVFILYLLFMVASFLSPKYRGVVNGSLLLIASLYLFLQDLYFQVFGDLFSFKEGGTLREGVESAENMIHLSWYQGFIVMTVVLMFVLFKKVKTPSVPSYSLASKLTSVFLLLALINLNADYPVKLARLHTSDHYLYTSVFSRKAFVENYGSFNLIIRDLSKTLAPDFTYKDNIEFLDNHFEDEEDTHEENPMSGLYKDKNLIYIVGESFDDLVINESLTPSLYRLKHGSLDFQNHYVPVFPRTTCDGEIMMNTGLIPSIEDGPTCYTYNANSYQSSLANRFNNEGYLTQAFHNNYKEFYTRDLVYEGFGYDALYGQHDLDLGETDKRYDSVFFEHAKNDIIKEDERFMSFILTLSGHSPYSDINLAGRKHYPEVDAYYGDEMDSELKYYIATQMELDRMVGLLFEDLEAKGVLEETVIVLTTDHYPYTLDQTLYEDYKNIDKDYQKSKAPLYIYSEGQTRTRVNRLTTSLDLLPTLLNLFDIESDYRYYIGRDMFSGGTSQVYYKDYSVYTGDTRYYLSDSVEDGLIPSYEKALLDYELSKRILRTDYLGYE